MLRTSLAAVSLFFAVTSTTAAELPVMPRSAALIDGDMVWELSEPNCFAISPDDKQIAYVSRGAIWMSDVTSGPPKKLADLPETVTALLNTAEYRDGRAEFNKLGSKVRSAVLSDKRAQDALAVFGLAWTPSQDGVVFAVRDRWQVSTQTWGLHVRHVSTDGSVKAIATIDRSSSENPYVLTGCYLTRHKNAVVVSVGNASLIWVTASNKPRATHFDYLLPSATSDRFLGVEIDTRQLVETDEDFKVIKRFDVTLVAQQQCDLVWSADRRFAICRQAIGYPSHKWAGFRIDLKSGEKRDLASSYLREQFVFTGRDGEFVRVGMKDVEFGDTGDGANGTYISLTPDGSGPERDIARFTKPYRPSEDWRMRKLYPPVRVSRNGTSFAMAFPRAKGKYGYRYDLIGRDGKRWPMGADDDSLWVSPYRVVAVANGGQTIVACDDTRLFSIPVEAIQKAGAASDE